MHIHIHIMHISRKQGWRIYIYKYIYLTWARDGRPGRGRTAGRPGRGPCKVYVYVDAYAYVCVYVYVPFLGPSKIEQKTKKLLTVHQGKGMGAWVRPSPRTLNLHSYLGFSQELTDR